MAKEIYHALLDPAYQDAYIDVDEARTRTLAGGQIREEADPAKRRGMRAGVRLTADGQKCVRIKAGSEVALRAEMTMPENAGEITSVRYDFNDRWTFPDKVDGLFPVEGSFTRTLRDGVHGAVSELTHRFDEPGTHFVSVRVTSNRYGDTSDIFTQVKNLDRVRIIVE